MYFNACSKVCPELNLFNMKQRNQKKTQKELLSVLFFLSQHWTDFLWESFQQIWPKEYLFYPILSKKTCETIFIGYFEIWNDILSYIAFDRIFLKVSDLIFRNSFMSGFQRISTHSKLWELEKCWLDSEDVISWDF